MNIFIHSVEALKILSPKPYHRDTVKAEKLEDGDGMMVLLSPLARCRLQGVGSVDLLLCMQEILHHQLYPIPQELQYAGDLKWCKISSMHHRSWGRRIFTSFVRSPLIRVTIFLGFMRDTPHLSIGSRQG